jgi:hypothetical protein
MLVDVRIEEADRNEMLVLCPSAPSHETYASKDEVRIRQEGNIFPPNWEPE